MTIRLAFTPIALVALLAGCAAEEEPADTDTDTDTDVVEVDEANLRVLRTTSTPAVGSIFVKTLAMSLLCWCCIHQRDRLRSAPRRHLRRPDQRCWHHGCRRRLHR